MKRRVLVLVLATLVAGGAFADSMFSAGGGFSFSGGRVGRVFYNSNNWMGMDALGFGGHIFFDATFVEASLGIMGGPMYEVWAEDGSRNSERMGSHLSMELSLLGKFPIAIGDSTAIFPLLGIGANIVLGLRDEDGNDLSDWIDVGDYSTFRLKLGVGADFDITNAIFFRAQGLGWYGFAPTAVRDAADYFGSGVSARGGFGGSVRLAIGFRF